MKTATEIAKLHSLFLSQDPANWQLAAMMCSEGEFEKVVEMEVERLKLTLLDVNESYHSFFGSSFVWTLGWISICQCDLVYDICYGAGSFKELDLEPATKRWRNQLKALKSAVA